MARIYKLRQREIARDKQVWMGIDVHKESWTVTIVDGERALHQQRYDADIVHMKALLARLPGCRILAVYEAGPTGYTLAKQLRELGLFDVFMTPPSLVPVRSGDRVKTDRRDSLKLAELLRADMLDSIAELEAESYEHRELLRTREQVMQHRSDICRQIKSKLLFHGIRIPSELSGGSWSKKLLKWLASSPTESSSLNLCLEVLVQSHRDLTEQIQRLEREIKDVSKQEAYAEAVELLCTVKGIGLLTAMWILVELEDLSRFSSSDKLASFLGLVPGEHTTGDNPRKGHITRTGNKRVRTVLVEASWRLIRYDSQLKKSYERLRSGRGPKRAIVAVARKLSGRLRAMLRDGVAYRYPPLESDSTEQSG